MYQLHKVYNEVGQACERYVSDNGYVSLRESRLFNNQAEITLLYHTAYSDPTPSYYSNLDITNYMNNKQGRNNILKYKHL